MLGTHPAEWEMGRKVTADAVMTWIGQVFASRGRHEMGESWRANHEALFGWAEFHMDVPITQKGSPAIPVPDIHVLERPEAACRRGGYQPG